GPGRRARIDQHNERPAARSHHGDRGRLAWEAGAAIRDQQPGSEEDEGEVNDHGRATATATTTRNAPQSRYRLQGGTAGGRTGGHDGQLIRQRMMPRARRRGNRSRSRQPAMPSRTPVVRVTSNAGQAPGLVAISKGVAEMVPRGTRRTVAAAGSTIGFMAMMGMAAMTRSTPPQMLACPPLMELTHRGLSSVAGARRI